MSSEHNDLEYPVIYGMCGSRLIVPYPDEAVGPFRMCEILLSFKSVLEHPQVVDYLYNSPKVTVSDMDISTILVESSRETLELMIQNDDFMSRRSKIFSLNRSSEKFLNNSSSVVESLSKYMGSMSSMGMNPPPAGVSTIKNIQMAPSVNTPAYSYRKKVAEVSEITDENEVD